MGEVKEELPYGSDAWRWDTRMLVPKTDDRSLVDSLQWNTLSGLLGRQARVIHEFKVLLELRGWKSAMTRAMTILTNAISRRSTSMASCAVLKVQIILILYDSRLPLQVFLVSSKSRMTGLTKCCHSSSACGEWLYALEYLTSSKVVVAVVEKDIIELLHYRG